MATKPVPPNTSQEPGAGAAGTTNASKQDLNGPLDKALFARAENIWKAYSKWIQVRLLAVFSERSISEERAPAFAV